MNMRAALPKALFLAFTGTPLIAGEERTREVFGDYVSIYDFQQSIEDGATVPLYYENRTPELQLVNPDLNDDIYELIEQAELDPEQEARLEQELSRQYHLITRDDRLDTVAKDIVRHFTGRGFQGKAMVVAIASRSKTRLKAFRAPIPRPRRFSHRKQRRFSSICMKTISAMVTARSGRHRASQSLSAGPGRCQVAVLYPPGRRAAKMMSMKITERNTERNKHPQRRAAATAARYPTRKARGR